MEEKTIYNNEEEETVGIVSMECYFPKLYISQTEFEQFNNVSSGKYTIGLGQDSMAFTTDREDICSISMTVLSNLLSKNNISYSDIGWICVATETIIDHSKSISSMLMELFKENGNHEIEGIDVKHACYAGTFALFTAFERITSKYWDGKYCIVITADIAEYAQGPARCTGGCGAMALLLGKNACIDLDVLRASYKAHEYDFCKPNLHSPYPVVNGHVSNACYLNALDSCFTGYKHKCKQWRPIHHADIEERANDSDNNSIDDVEHEYVSPDYWVFHAPYNKLVSKTFGRVIYHDFLNHPQVYFRKYAKDEQMMAFLRKYEKMSYKDTVNTREVIKGFEKISKSFYKSYVDPTTLIPKKVGNCYTASIFMGLMSLINECADDLENKLIGKTIQMFSYGSGTLASLYSLRVIKSAQSLKLLKKIVENNDIKHRLDQRTKISCDEYTKITNDKAMQFHNTDEMMIDFVPLSKVEKDYFYTNTYYLTKMDTKKQRFYEKFECKRVDLQCKTTKIVTMNEEAINQNIARFKVDDDEVEMNEVNEKIKGFEIPNVAQLINDKMLNQSLKILEKAEDNGLSKKGAIKIDKMLNNAHQVATKCSNS